MRIVEGCKQKTQQENSLDSHCGCPPPPPKHTQALAEHKGSKNGRLQSTRRSEGVARPLSSEAPTIDVWMERGLHPNPRLSTGTCFRQRGPPASDEEPRRTARWQNSGDPKKTVHGAAEKTNAVQQSKATHSDGTDNTFLGQVERAFIALRVETDFSGYEGRCSGTGQPAPVCWLVAIAGAARSGVKTHTNELGYSRYGYRSVLSAPCDKQCPWTVPSVTKLKFIAKHWFVASIVCVFCGGAP